MEYSTIICVDDEDIILQSLELELSELLDDQYDLELVQSSREALKLVEELVSEGTPIPLVITDYIMPDMKGDELLIEINNHSPETLGVLLTGQSSVEGIINAINQANLYRYLSKPWQKADLILTIKEALTKYNQKHIIKRQYGELIQLNSELEAKVHQRTEEIKEKNRYLEEKNDELEIQKGQLKELNQLKDKLFSIISHDLKGPLNSLRSVLDLVSKGGLSADELQELTGSLNERVNQTYHLLENLLNWAKSQMEGKTINPQEIDIRELAQANQKLFAKIAEDKHIEIINQVPQDSFVFADKDMINLVIRNLISNAIKFTDSHGKIMISSEIDKNGKRKVSISDNGQGIPQEKQALLFDIRNSFSTLGTKEEAGTGLGLGLCKDSIEKNHGRIWVESQEGVGSTFHFVLPIENKH